MSKLKYRNTGFIRQLGVFIGRKYLLIEWGRWYLRYYQPVQEGVIPKYYREIRL